MELLYSDILPLGKEEGKRTILEAVEDYASAADSIEIAVGYVSRASLEELDQYHEKYALKHITLNMGMYYLEGMPESSYHTATRLNQKWISNQNGEIRLIKVFKYHGKVFVFYRDGEPFAVISGSANLGVMKLDANNRRQYEVSEATTDRNECMEFAKLVSQLKEDIISSNIGEIDSVPLIREKNTALSGVELVTTVPKSNIDFYRRCMAYVSFLLPLKVPAYSERHMDDGKHFTKSNVNVCYAAPRSRRKPRDWFETQLTVSSKIYNMTGYPQKNVPFFVITDDGYWFKAHTTSDNNKQFSAVGDELIMGRWLKGRLVAAGLISPVNNTQMDTDRTGMITKEVLLEYGCDALYFKKTGQTAIDEDGNELDVWMLSFDPVDMGDELQCSI